jgi:hypothetical protein
LHAPGLALVAEKVRIRRRFIEVKLGINITKGRTFFEALVNMNLLALVHYT